MEGPRVGFIGLGLMGGSMSRVLLSKGFPVRGYDLDPKKVAAVVELGGKGADSPAEVASSVDILCTSLPNGAILKDVCLGSGDALAQLAPGSVLVDFSTTEPEAIRELHAAAIQRGIEVVDAPVSGGPAEIPAGKLVVLVGCSDEAFRRAEPVLTALAGGGLHRIGKVGDARVVKLVNNVIAMGNVLIAAEGFTLGVKAGVDPKTLFDVLSNSGARSNHLNKRFPWALQRDFAPRFSMNNAIKDLRLGLVLGQEVGSPMPAASVIQQLFSAAAAQGHGEEDAVAVLRLFEAWAGVEADARDAGREGV